MKLFQPLNVALLNAFGRDAQCSMEAPLSELAHLSIGYRQLHLHDPVRPVSEEESAAEMV